MQSLTIKNRRQSSLQIRIADHWKYPDFLELLSLEPEELLRLPQTTLLSTVPSTTVVTTVFRNQRLYFKYFLESRSISVLKTMFRGSKAMRALKGAKLLSKISIDTPEIIAVRQNRCPALQHVSLLVTCHKEGENLRSILRTENLDCRMRHLLVSCLGEFIAHMHNNRIVHGDLHPGNILMSGIRLSNGASASFALMDTERVRKVHALNSRKIFRDLALLNHPNLGCITPLDRLRFIATYYKEMDFQKNNIRPSDIRGLTAKIHAMSYYRYGKKRTNNLEYATPKK